MDCNPKIQAFIASPGLTRQYRVGPSTVRALDGLDLDVRQGEFLAGLGVSGSGKSRLLHLLGGLDTPSSGSVAVEDPGTRCGSRRMWPAEPAWTRRRPDAWPWRPPGPDADPGEGGRQSRPYGPCPAHPMLCRRHPANVAGIAGPTDFVMAWALGRLVDFPLGQAGLDAGPAVGDSVSP